MGELLHEVPIGVGDRRLLAALFSQVDDTLARQ